MKKLLIYLLLLLSANTIFAQLGNRIVYLSKSNFSNNTYVPTDSTVYYYPNENTGLKNEEVLNIYNISGQSYTPNSKSVYEYNSEGKITTQTIMEWDGSQWRNINKYESTYNAQNQVTRQSSFYWFANNWFENNRLDYSYNIQGLLTETVRQDTSNGLLVLKSRWESTYDNLQRRTQSLQQVWSTNSSSWLNSGRTETFYNGSTTRVDSVHSYSVINPGSIWRLYYKTFNSYGIGNKLTESLELYDINFDSNFLNFRRYSYDYDNNGNESVWLYQEWQNNAWRDNSKSNRTFDNLNRPTELVFQTYNAQQSQLVNSSKQVNTYEPDSSLITYMGYSWANQDWDPTYKFVYAYEPIQEETSGVLENNKAGIKSYPNPFTINTIIEFESKQAGKANIQITDNTGRIVFENQQNIQPGINNVLWNATDVNENSLPSGIYFFMLKAENLLITNKLMKL
jgi:hypothetical protein